MRYFLLVCLVFPALAFADSLDDVSLKLMQLARNHITEAKLNDGSFVREETEAEKRNPIIPVKDAKRVVDMGSKSALAGWCGVDYRPYYLQFMQHERSQYNWSDKQIAYIGLLHGLSVSAYKQAVEGRGACSDAQRKHTLAQLNAVLNTH